MGFELLDPGKVRVGNWYLDATTEHVPSVLPDNNVHFNKDKPAAPRPRKARFFCVRPFEIYEVDEGGFKYRNSKGQPEGEQRFDKFMDGIVMSKADETKLYVDEEFLESLKEYDG